MAKRVIWSKRAQKERRKILEYWAKRTGDKVFSKKLSNEFRQKIKHIAQHNYMGTETDIENVRMTVCRYYLIFYEITGSSIEILSIWDGRRNPEESPFNPKHT